MITSKESLISYIRSQLGEPTITIELTNEQISTVISDVIKTYTDVVYGDFEDSIILKRDMLDPFGKVYLPMFSSILQVLPANGDIRIPAVIGYPGAGALTVPVNGCTKKALVHNWNNISRTLTLLNPEIPDVMMVVGLKKYEPNETSDYIYNESWVKEMCKAQTKKLWGHVVGKYSQSLVGGATINFDRLISEGQTEIDALMEELNDKWVDPAPVLVG